MAIQANVIENGVHYLSGIGSTTYHDEWNNEYIDVELFCIDDVVYGAYSTDKELIRVIPKWNETVEEK